MNVEVHKLAVLIKIFYKLKKYKLQSSRYLTHWSDQKYFLKIISSNHIILCVICSQMVLYGAQIKSFVVALEAKDNVV